MPLREPDCRCRSVRFPIVLLACPTTMYARLDFCRNDLIFIIKQKSDFHRFKLTGNRLVGYSDHHGFLQIWYIFRHIRHIGKLQILLNILIKENDLPALTKEFLIEPWFPLCLALITIIGIWTSFSCHLFRSWISFLYIRSPQALSRNPQKV